MVDNVACPFCLRNLEPIEVPNHKDECPTWGLETPTDSLYDEPAHHNPPPTRGYRNIAVNILLCVLLLVMVTVGTLIF